jgi:hypothetical protein
MCTRKTRDRVDFSTTFDLICKSINFDLKDDFSKLLKSVAVNLHSLGKCGASLDESQRTVAPFLVLKSVLHAILRDMNDMVDKVVEIDDEIDDDTPLDNLREAEETIEALKVVDVILSSFTSTPEPDTPSDEVPGGKLDLRSK